MLDFLICLFRFAFFSISRYTYVCIFSYFMWQYNRWFRISVCLVLVNEWNKGLFTRVIERYMNTEKESCNICLLNSTILVNSVGIGVPPLLNEPFNVVKSTFFLFREQIITPEEENDHIFSASRHILDSLSFLYSDKCKRRNVDVRQLYRSMSSISELYVEKRNRTKCRLSIDHQEIKIANRQLFDLWSNWSSRKIFYFDISLFLLC